MNNLTTKQWIIRIAAVIAVAIGIFFAGNCHGESNVIQKENVKTIEITMPERKGSFDSVVPIAIEPATSVETTILYKDKYLKLLKQVDMMKVKSFTEALKDETDPTKPLQLYAKAVEINTYEETFKNGDIEITINARTTGTLDYLKPDWKIPERKEKVDVILPPEKKVVFSAYLGAQLYSNTTEIKPGIKVDVGLQRKNGDMITASYGVHGVNNTVFVGYTKKLFDIKR